MCFFTVVSLDVDVAQRADSIDTTLQFVQRHTSAESGPYWMYQAVSVKRSGSSNSSAIDASSLVSVDPFLAPANEVADSLRDPFRPGTHK